jgi:molybdopterin-guanine dinucleotide biosynthesis protein A
MATNGKLIGITAIILVGGQSIRLGQDKAVQAVGRAPLLQRVVEVMENLAGELLLVTAPSMGERLVVSKPGVRWVEDIYPGKGSLGGIYTGLHHASSYHCMVVACDMPFLNKSLLDYMIEIAPGNDVVVPEVSGHLEPLHALYSKDCLGPIRTLMEDDNLKVIDLFPDVRVRRVTQEEVDRFDPEHLSFFNINTLADLDQARSHITLTLAA